MARTASIFVLLVSVAALCSSGGAAQPATHVAAADALTGDALRRAVADCLRRWPEGTLPDEAGLRQMLSLYQRLKADRSLAEADRQRRIEALAARLVGIGRALQRAIAQQLPAGTQHPATPGNAPSGLAPADQHVLGQFGVPGGGGNATFGIGPGQQVPDRGQELVKLIEAVIAPAQWDTVGGGNVIRYYRPARALVIHADGATHEQLSDMLGQLR